MADRRIELEIVASANQATAAINAFFANIGKQSEAIKQVNAAYREAGEAVARIAGAMAAIFGARQLDTFASQAMERRKAFAGLDSALKSSKQYTAAYTDELKRQREELERLAGVDEDELAMVQQRLISLGVTSENMGRATELTLDLAAAMGTDVAQAARNLGNAMAGDDVILRGYRLEIDRTLPKTQQLAQLFDQLGEKVGGRARDAFQNTAPDVVRFRNSIQELKNDLGDVVINSGVYQELTRVTEALRQVNPEIVKCTMLAGGLVAAMAGMQTVFWMLGPSIKVAGFAFSVLIAALAGTDLVGIFRGITTSGSKVTDFLLALKAYALEIRAVVSGLFRIAGVATSIGAAFYAAYKYWIMLKSELGATEAKDNLSTGAIDLRNKLIGAINNEAAAGKITQDQRAQMLESLRQADDAYVKLKSDVFQYADAVKAVAARNKELMDSQVIAKAKAPRASSAAEVEAAKTSEREINAARMDLVGEQLAQEHDLRLSTDKEYFDAKKKLIDDQYANEKAKLQEELAFLQSEIARVNREGDASNREQKLQELNTKRIQTIGKIDQAEIASGQKQLALWAEMDQARSKQANESLEASKREIEQRLKLVEIDKAMLQSDWRTADFDKRNKTIALLQEELNIYKQQAVALQEKIDASQTYDERKAYQDELRGVNSNITDTSSALQQQQSGPDPYSYIDQIQYKFAALRESWGTNAMQMANILTSTVTNAVHGLSNALTNVIMGTQSAAQAFGQFALQMAMQFVASVVEMILIATVAIPILTALGILSGGSIPTTGATMTTLALGVGSSLASSYSRAEGGIIPGAPSSRDNRLAYVATGEYVARSKAVSYYGSGLFDALNNMRIPRDQLSRFLSSSAKGGYSFADGGLVGAGAGVNVAPAPVNVAVFDDVNKLRSFLGGSSGESMIVNIVKKNKAAIGIRS